MEEYGKPGVGIAAVAKKGSAKYESGAAAERKVAAMLREVLQHTDALVIHDAKIPTTGAGKVYDANVDHIVIGSKRNGRMVGWLIETKGWGAGWYTTWGGGLQWRTSKKGRATYVAGQTVPLAIARYREASAGEPIEWKAVMVTTNSPVHVLGLNGFRAVSLEKAASMMRRVPKHAVPEDYTKKVLRWAGNPKPASGRRR